MATIAPALPSLPALPTRAAYGQPRQFRLLKHAESRWDVQRLEHRWYSIYSDDSAARAFEQLKRSVDAADGCVACSRCGWTIDRPRLRHGQVLCGVCHALSGSDPWFPLVGIAVFFVIWLALMFWLGHFINLLLVGGM